MREFYPIKKQTKTKHLRKSQSQYQLEDNVPQSNMENYRFLNYAFYRPILIPYRNPQFTPEEPKPQHSYIGLIAMAILSSAESKLVLSDIYQHILDHYPYFRSRGPGWRNSIRHNLSLNDCFIKSGRSANGKPQKF